MANGLNKVMMIGNLGKDPEIRYTQNGSAVCNLRVAVTEKSKVGDKWEDKTEWVDVVAWGKTAENCGQYLVKGRQIYVEGRLQTRKWEDKDHKDRWSTEVVAFKVIFLAGGGEGERSQNGNVSPKGKSSPKADANAGNDDGFYDDDLPF